jgi:hypothetical protein
MPQNMERNRFMATGCYYLFGYYSRGRSGFDGNEKVSQYKPMGRVKSKLKKIKWKLFFKNR